jgi:hypothetical protein
VIDDPSQALLRPLVSNIQIGVSNRLALEKTG